MTIDTEEVLDPGLMRELFDLRSDTYAARGGAFDVEIEPLFNALRNTHPIHVGTPGELVGYTGPAFFVGLPLPDRPHFTVFDYHTCTDILKNQTLFSASPNVHDPVAYANETLLLFMDKKPHRRLRSLVQRMFLPAHLNWWLEKWIADTVDRLVRPLEEKGRADLNVELFAAIPLLTICHSFGISLTDALEIRAGVVSDGAGIDAMRRILTPIIHDRRVRPRDDLISVLVQAELLEEDGSRLTLSDEDVFLFSFFLLAAGSGTTWKQLGITMLTLLEHPAWLSRVREHPELLDDVIEETLRWRPTDPAFARHVVEDTVLHGMAVPQGSVVHLNFTSANRDPARWDRPDEFDPSRGRLSHLGFGGGAHVCLGQFVARAEISTAIAVLLQRLPNLRLDPDAEAPRIIGMYERGPSSVPVVWDPIGGKNRERPDEQETVA